MKLDKATMEFCIEQCANAVAGPDLLAGLSDNAKGQSAMAESLANQLKNALAESESSAAPVPPAV